MIIPVCRVEIPPGTSAREAVFEICAYAAKNNCKVEFKFNEIEMYVYPDDDPEIALYRLISKIENQTII